MSLGSFGPDMTRDAIKKVAGLLADQDPTVRHAAALSLGNYGPSAKAAPR